MTSSVDNLNSITSSSPELLLPSTASSAKMQRQRHLTTITKTPKAPTSWRSQQKQQQRNNGCFSKMNIFNNGSSSTTSSQWLLAIGLLGLLFVAVQAVDEKTVQSSAASPSSTLSSGVVGSRDEIYIDDEGTEGSGGRGEIHDDLEKDPDYSGSGFGPDDEDSSTDHHRRRPSIQTQSGNSNKANTNDFNNNNINNNNNDLITSRTHQSNSGTIIGSGTSGNQGILSGSGNSGNTGLNTIGKNHSSTTSSSSTTPIIITTTTTATIDTINTVNKQPEHTITSYNPSQTTQTQTNLSPSTPKSPEIHTDDDDFDLDETIGGGSGNGGIIDRDDEDDDDDGGDDDNIDGGDDDDDGDNDDVGSDADILSRARQHHKLSTATTNGEIKPINVDVGTNVDEDHSVDPYHHSSKEDRKQILGGGGKTDDFNEEETQKNHDLDHDDNEGSDDDDDGTEMYTDVTDPNSGTGGVGPTHKQPGGINNQGTIHELDANSINSLAPDHKVIEHTTGNEVLIMSDDERTTSFFAQPGILAAVIGGAVVGLLCAILVVMFIVYRMRKKDEGSYALDEPKRSPAVNSYAKNANNREFYA